MSIGTDKELFNWYKRYSGLDTYTGSHYINPNVRWEIDREVKKYEEINERQPVYVTKGNGEKFVDSFYVGKDGVRRYIRFRAEDWELMKLRFECESYYES